MIPIGARVRCKAEVRVTYGKGKKDDVVPPGSVGEVTYRPKDEDPGANFEIGVLWTRPDGTLCGIEVNESEVDILLDHVSFGSLPPFETLGAIKRLFHYSWKDIAYEHAGLTPSEKEAISPEEFEALKAWIFPRVGDRVVARTQITEAGGKTIGNPDAVRGADKAFPPDWIHAEIGDRGVVVGLDTDGYPTVRFERTDTATITDFGEIE